MKEDFINMSVIEQSHIKTVQLIILIISIDQSEDAFYNKYYSLNKKETVIILGTKEQYETVREVTIKNLELIQI